MGNRIGHRFKNSIHRILGYVDTMRGLAGADFHVALDETEGRENLPVKRPGKVACIELIVCVTVFTPIADRLDKGVRDELLWFLRFFGVFW